MPALLVQLDRMSAYEVDGREFESPTGYLFYPYGGEVGRVLARARGTPHAEAVWVEELVSTQAYSRYIEVEGQKHIFREHEFAKQKSE